MRMPTVITATADARPLDERVAHVADIAARYAGEVDAAARFPAEAVDAMRSTGLLGASLPVGLGGEGLTLVQLGSIAAKLGAACSTPTPSCAFRPPTSPRTRTSTPLA